MSSADIVIGQPDPEALRESTQLKWLQVSSSSITRYDYPAFRSTMAQRGVMVCNSASVYREACAEHLLSFMLAQARLLPVALASRAAGATSQWNFIRSSSIPLRGQSALILGLGAIGYRLVQLLAPFEMRIQGYRRKARGDEPVPLVELDDLNTALGNTDHIINILPDSPETRGFFGPARFASMSRSAVFYNIGRGLSVDQDALCAALHSGQLKAAWLDVTDPEPLPDDHPLWKQSNCHITPHVAGGHENESHTFVRHFLGNLSRFEQGQPLLDRVM